VSAAQVRTQVATFFQGASIPGLNKVFTAPPWWADGSLWELNAQNGSGAIGALHIVSQDESRLTVPWQTGSKRVEYVLGLMVFYQFLQPQTLAPQTEDAWNGPLDVILDGIAAKIRSDPQCGIPQGEVWQSGEDPHDVRIRRDVPRNLPGKVLSWNVVEFHVTEIIEA
jgi:hypothetical protein